MIEPYNIDLSKFISEDSIRHQSFTYADIDGEADIIGLHIVIFYKNNSKNVSAISIGEPDNIRNVSLLLSVENKILDSIKFPIHIWDSKNKIFDSFGTDYTVDNITIEKKYQFDVNEEYFISIGTRNDIISSIEIVLDKEIIKKIHEVR